MEDRIDLEAYRRVADSVLECGIAFLATADIYGDGGGSEAALGENLGARRQDIVLATKFGVVMDELLSFVRERGPSEGGRDS